MARKEKDTVMEIIEHTEKKPLRDLNPVELRILQVCHPDMPINEKKACYRGFWEGINFQKEKKEVK